jgi:hypothetical protein
LTNACCRWPYGELGRGRFFFCGEVGADLARGIPYCPRHMQRAYIVPPTLVKPLHKIIARAAITSRQRPSPQLAIKRAPSISARCGSGVNGLDTGSVAANTWYAVFAIYNPTTKTTAALLSTSTTSPTLPSGYTYLTRVGWMRTSASSQFLRVLQQGRRAQYVVTAASNTANLPIMVTGVNGSVSTPTWTCD